MALTDTKIHHIELLLTIDYLLKYTDEAHPATQIDICEHANKFGLKFDKNAKSGNQVRRQRIGECLQFLKHLCDNFPTDVPFILETTRSGKYYIEQKGGLNEIQIAKILAAIVNDKYTKSEDIDYLIECILSAFATSDEHKAHIKYNAKKLIKGGKKYDKETIRKITLIEKAYRENMMIKCRFSVTDTVRKKIVDYYFWYKVYLIKEYNHKLYAFMLPIGQINMDDQIGRPTFFDNYIFKKIEDIDIPSGSEKTLLCEDFSSRRDFEKLFAEKCPRLAKKFGSIDEMLNSKILPNGGKTKIVSFYFNLGLTKILKRSFEEFFSEDFRYQVTNNVKGIESSIEDFVGEMDNWLIVTDEPKVGEVAKFGLVNISVDINSFKSWLLSDPHGNGKVNILDMVTIIKPLSLNEEIAEYYYHQLMKRDKYLKDSFKANLVRKYDTKINITEDDYEEYFNYEGEIRKQLNYSLKTKENFILVKDICGSYLLEVKYWLDDNKDKVNGYIIDGSSSFNLNGITRQITDLTLVGQAFTNEEIDKLSSTPNLVAIVDNYDRLDNNSKSHILLLSDGYVIDEREEDGVRKLKNLQFVTIVKDK